MHDSPSEEHTGLSHDLAPDVGNQTGSLTDALDDCWTRVIAAILALRG